MAGEMLDRVAQAIWNMNRPDLAPSYDDLDALDKGRVQMIARAAIEALMKPTEDMIGAYDEAAGYVDRSFDQASFETMIKVGMGDLEWSKEEKKDE